MAFKGRLAIIAGGLGGLGSATALHLHSLGASLALLYAPFEASRKQDVLENTFGAKLPADITTYECDITSEPSVSAAFASVKEHCEASSLFPSILINAAGYVHVSPLEAQTAEEASKTFNANLLGPFIVSNAFANLFFSFSNSQPPPPGRIISISSQAAHVALHGHGAYCASKAGLNGLTRCMASEWGPRGITANTVSPTVALTELGKKAWGEGEVRDKMLAGIPTGRFVEPEEVAGVIGWLCGDGSGMVNGEDVRVDGGFTIR